MGSKKKKKDATYQAAVSGAKGAIRILLYVLLICILIFVGKTEKLSDYRGKIKPGTYLLNTHETVDQMLAILSGKNTEGQPSEEEESSSSDAENPESGEESVS